MSTKFTCLVCFIVSQKEIFPIKKLQVINYNVNNFQVNSCNFFNGVSSFTLHLRQLLDLSTTDRNKVFLIRCLSVITFCWMIVSWCFVLFFVFSAKRPQVIFLYCDSKFGSTKSVRVRNN